MKPTLPQGTRDFNAATVRKRNYIFNTIRNVFELYGFEPLETPAMENLETLTGKYGEEGDKLIFRILDSGNPFKKEFFEALKEFFKLRYDYVEVLKKDESSGIVHNPYDIKLKDIDADKIASIATHLNEKNNSKYLSNFKTKISEKALRYDLTIPFARYVAMNYNHLTLPYKRYQMQPVWRADRPQKGRYREFYQCDADVVGSTSTITEIELLKLYDEVFTKLKIPQIEIKINTRPVLKAFAYLLGDETRMTIIANIIDKIDKIGIESVKEELHQLVGGNTIYTAIIDDYLQIEGSNEDKINLLTSLIQKNGNDIDLQAFGRLKTITDFFRDNPSNIPIIIDYNLARGLNYYTGLIVEVKCNSVKIGSIGGGGAYHDLTGLFGVPDIPGVGISFGVDRIYDVMEELKLFPEEIYTGTQALFLNLGEAEGSTAFALMQQLRAKNIRCEMYHENAKFDKQFKYAEKKGIGYTVKIGDKELADGTCVVKDIRSGEQHTISQSALVLFNFHR